MSEQELDVNRTRDHKKVGCSGFTAYATCVASMTRSRWSLFSAEYRDDEIGQHMRRVGALSALLGLAIDRPPREIALLRAAAPLHDVGKISVPDHILEKPGKLTEAEFNQMKSHTFIGSLILAGSRFRVLHVARQIALSHHERWDGTGYPQGLVGDAIPLPARITAIADVFDALTHARPYKKAWNLKKAIEAIEQESGRHFDPALVHPFLSVLRAEGLQRLAARIAVENRSPNRTEDDMDIQRTIYPEIAGGQHSSVPEDW